MAPVQVKCPSCSATLRLKAQTTGNLRINCPKCKDQFDVVVAKPITAAPEAANLDSFDSFDSLPLDNLLPAPLAPTQNPAFNASVSAYKPQRKPRKTKLPQLRLLKIGLASAAGVAFLIVALLWIIPKLGDGSLTSLLPNFDSRDSIIADLLAESARIEGYGIALVEAGESTESSERLLREEAVFQRLIYRGGSLSLETPSVETLREREAAFRKQISELRASPPVPADIKSNPMHNNAFWTKHHTANFDRIPTSYAVDRLTRLRAIAVDLPSLAVELPNPILGDPIDPAWTDAGRQRLQAYYIQGRFQRDFARELAKIDRQAVSDSNLNRLHEIIDQYLDEAREMTRSPRLSYSSDSSFFVQVPRGSAYEMLKSSAAVAMLKLADIFDEDCHENARLMFLLKDQTRVADEIGDLIFNHHLKLAGNSRDRWDTAVGLENEKIAKEEQRLADLHAQETKREQERQRQLAEAAEQQRREREARERDEEERRNRLADSSTPSAGSAPNSGNASRDSAMGPRSRSSLGSNGSGRFGDNAPESFSEPAAGTIVPPPGARGRAAQRRPEDPALSVTIQVDPVMAISSRYVMENCSRELRVFGLSTAQSNQSLTITVRNFDKPIDSLQEYFPYLEFETIDQASRTIVAREKSGP